MGHLLQLYQTHLRLTLLIYQVGFHHHHHICPKNIVFLAPSFSVICSKYQVLVHFLPTNTLLSIFPPPPKKKKKEEENPFFC